MVIGSRRGASTLGCLFSLLLFVAALYYGINIGEVYVRYYRLQDEIRAQARLAPSLTDDVIRRRVLDEIETLGLPAAAREQLRIERPARRRVIVIHTEYTETLELPFVHRTLTFRPRAEEPI